MDLQRKHDISFKKVKTFLYFLKFRKYAEALVEHNIVSKLSMNSSNGFKDYAHGNGRNICCNT